nr:ATP-dependent RNA helicase [Andalucia godoyi]|eukprot:ANDGO_00819.mRNA.1 DEAD-box ATP-dependent RNA helicase 1
MSFEKSSSSHGETRSWNASRKRPRREAELLTADELEERRKKKLKRKAEVASERKSRLDVKEALEEKLRQVSLPLWMRQGTVISATLSDRTSSLSTATTDELDEPVAESQREPEWRSDAESANMKLRTLKRRLKSRFGSVKEWKLVYRILEQKMKIDTLFPVQTYLIDYLSKLIIERGVGDVACAAPTGSGKTLAYVLPLLMQLLWNVSPRGPLRLSAVVLVPTRDLARQVGSVLEVFCKAAGYILQVCTGSKSFAAEQSLLMQPGPLDKFHLASRDAVGDRADQNMLKRRGVPFVLDAQTACHVIVATPGRFMDHVTQTAGFSTALSHLQVLVLDEADKLLAQSYDDWLHRLLPLLGPWCRKMLFSATLTRNPGKIAALRLVNPRYFSVTEAHVTKRFVTPESLTQQYAVVSAEHKPHALLHLLEYAREHDLLPCVCFTSSVETAHRLFRMCQAYYGAVQEDSRDKKKDQRDRTWNGNQARNDPEKKPLLDDFVFAEYSSALDQQLKTQLLQSLERVGVDDRKARKADPQNMVVLCSDAMSRGLDVSSIRLVISYDAPAHVTTYIHRVGRTARAGRAGTAISLLRSQEVRFFKDLMRKAQHAKPVTELRTHFERDDARLEYALQTVRNVLAEEANHKVPLSGPIPAELYPQEEPEEDGGYI